MKKIVSSINHYGPIECHMEKVQCDSSLMLHTQTNSRCSVKGKTNKQAF